MAGAASCCECGCKTVHRKTHWIVQRGCLGSRIFGGKQRTSLAGAVRLFIQQEQHSSQPLVIIIFGFGDSIGYWQF